MPTTAYLNVLNLITSNLPSGQQISATDHRAVENALLNFAESQWLPGDIKEIDCTQQYIIDNFDANGIGIGQREGWAICNGYNNLTRNRTGRVSVAYGTNQASGAPAFPSVGTSIFSPVLGGAANSIVVEHSHYTTKYGSVTNSNNSSLYDAPAGNIAANKERPLTSAAYDANVAAYDYELTSSVGTADAGKTNTVGSSGMNANMQPYIVTLFIQKL